MPTPVVFSNSPEFNAYLLKATGHLLVDSPTTLTAAITAANLEITTNGVNAKIIEAYLIANVTITGEIVIPWNLIFTPLHGSLFIKGTGGTMEFKGVGFHPATLKSETPVFKNFTLPLINFVASGYKATTNINLGTSTFTIPKHGFQNNQRLVYDDKSTGQIMYSSSGSSIALPVGGNLWVQNVTENTFQISVTDNGSPIVLTSIGTGNKYFKLLYWVNAVNIVDSTLLINLSFRNYTNGLSNNDKLEYFTYGTPIGGLTNNTSYYVSDVSATSAKLKTSVGASSTINLTDDGGPYGSLHYFTIRDIKFTGSLYPKEINYNLFDTTSDESFGYRLSMASSSLIGKKAKIFATGREMTNNPTFLQEGHELDLGSDNYPNNRTVPHYAVLFFPNIKIIGHRAKLNESSVGFWTAVLGPFDIRGDTKHVEFRGIDFYGTHTHFADPNKSTYSVGNATEGWLIDDMNSYKLQGYACHIGSYADRGHRAINGIAQNLTFADCYTQPLFLNNLHNATFKNIYFSYSENSAAPAAVMDAEPNDGRFEKISKVVFDNVHCDFRKNNGTGNSFGFLGFNSAGTTGIEDVQILNCSVYATAQLFAGLGAHGVAGLKIRNFEIRGVRDIGIDIYNSSDIEMENIVMKDIGLNGNNPYSTCLRLGGCRNVKIDGLSIRDTGKILNLNLYDKIYEHEVSMYAMSSSDNKIILSSYLEGSRGYGTSLTPRTWIGGVINYNNKDYRINDLQALTWGNLQRSFTTEQTVPTLSYVNATVAVGTNLWTSLTNHGFLLGSRVAMLPYLYASTGDVKYIQPLLPDGSPNPDYKYLPVHNRTETLPGLGEYTPPAYYYIIPTADPKKFYLADTLNDAIAGTSITFSTSGIDTYAIIPLVVTKFSNAIYKNVDAGQMFLEPTGSSRIIDDPLPKDYTVNSTSDWAQDRVCDFSPDLLREDEMGAVSMATSLVSREKYYATRTQLYLRPLMRRNRLGGKNLLDFTSETSNSPHLVVSPFESEVGASISIGFVTKSTYSSAHYGAQISGCTIVGNNPPTNPLDFYISLFRPDFIFHSGTSAIASPSSMPNPSIPHVVVLTISNSGASLYIDNVLIGSNNTNTPIPERLVIGGISFNSGARAETGRVVVVNRIWNVSELTDFYTDMKKYYGIA